MSSKPEEQPDIYATAPVASIVMIALSSRHQMTP